VTGNGDGTTHRLGHEAIHTYFDNSLPAALTIAPGDTVIFETLEPSRGRVARDFAADDRPDVAPDLAAIIAAAARPDVPTPLGGHALTGPVAIAGAEPGDALDVTIVAVEPARWGWNGVGPQNPLVGDLIPDGETHFWDLRARDYAPFDPDIRIPLAPFCGVLGVAPAEAGMHPTPPPRRGGGNMDIRQLTAGAVLTLPVLAPGALFSTGDAHAAQGDGEVGGTAIECDAVVTLRFDLRKGAAPNWPEFRTAGPLAPRTDTGPHFAATGHDTDPRAAARAALVGVLDYLEREHGLSRARACLLASACVDLRISQVVNAGTWTVTAFLPLSIFVGTCG
jgi:acetamidase/formamidase